MVLTWHACLLWQGGGRAGAATEAAAGASGAAGRLQRAPHQATRRRAAHASLRARRLACRDRPPASEGAVLLFCTTSLITAAGNRKSDPCVRHVQSCMCVRPWWFAAGATHTPFLISHDALPKLLLHLQKVEQQAMHLFRPQKSSIHAP